MNRPMSATNAAGTAQTHPPTQNRIVDGAARLRNYAANGAWLAPNNIYFSNCISEIDNGNIVEADLCEYVAASAVMHCIDGYSYLGRSIQSLLSADSYTATHLAYYA